MNFIESPKSKEKQPPLYDAIVIMPYSSNVNSKGQIRLSYWSDQSVNAGFSLYKQGLSDRIVIPGESVFGKDNTSTTELMVEYLLRKGVPHKNIVAMDNLNNTAFQLEAIKKLQTERHWHKLTVVATNWHKDRVKQVLEKMHISADTREVESILAFGHLSVRRAQDARKKMLEVPATAAIAAKDRKIMENPLLKQLWFQKAGVIIFGPRVVDLKDDTFGKKKAHLLAKKTA